MPQFIVMTSLIIWLDDLHHLENDMPQFIVKNQFNPPRSNLICYQELKVLA